MKKPLAIFLCMNLIATGIMVHESKYLTTSEKELMAKYIEYRPDSLIKKRMEEIEFEKKIEQKQQEIIEYLGSDEYKRKEKILELKKSTGLNVINYKEYTFKLTYYSSLPEENGGYTVTCNGSPLKGNIVANNTIPQGTKLILNDITYEVADRGSSRFNNITRLDVLVERLPGESDNQYRKRVSDKGVDNVTGYILEIN